jgi:hypothetical protein
MSQADFASTIFPDLFAPPHVTDTAIILKPAAALPTLPVEDIARAVEFARQDKAESTRKAYRADFTAFTAWCTGRGVSALPASPETVAGYLAAEAEAGKYPSTIGRRCAAIGHAHKLAGMEPPTNSELVKATLGASAGRWAPRRIGKLPRWRKSAATCRRLRRLAR